MHEDVVYDAQGLRTISKISKKYQKYEHFIQKNYDFFSTITYENRNHLEKDSHL
jgi:hypothetical protein